jgi:hypothetical protein
MLGRYNQEFRKMATAQPDHTTIVHPLYATPTRLDPPEPHPVPLYAATIHGAIATNDLSSLSTLICQAEAHLEAYGDLPVLIEQLKTEICKLER